MEEHVFGVPTNLVHEQDVGQVDLFRLRSSWESSCLGIFCTGS